MHHFFSRLRLRPVLAATVLAAATTLPALAQPGYLAIDALVAQNTYQDLGTTGTAIAVANPDDANSAPIPIGFTFPYAGQTFTQFIFNTNGFIKLGSVAPSSASLFLTNPQSYTGPGVFASTDPLDEFILAPFNYDLEPDAGGAADFRVSTTGTAPNRICTIQWKKVRDKSLRPANTTYASQFDSFEFQLKLYETTRQVEFVYGTATPSTNSVGFRGSHAGLKGVTGSTPLTVQKLSATTWSTPTFSDANYTGLRFNFKSDVRPTPGLTYRFLPDLCPRPANINVSVVGSTATVTFAGATGAQSYNVVYGPAGFVPPGGTTVTTTTNTATITGLVPGQTYAAYVQSSCGPSLLGGFAGPVYFCQPGTVTTLPYIENFDGVSGGNRLPCGVAVENVNGDTARWRNLRLNTLTSSVPNGMRIETRTNGGAAKDDWFYLPGIQMTGGQSYDISFAYRVGSSAQPERLEVMAGAAPNAAAMNELLFRDTLITRASFNNAPRGTGTFTAPSTGIFYFGFHAFSRPNRYRLYVDDIRVEPGPACAPIRGAISVRNVTPTSAQVNFTPGFGTNFIIKYGPRGFNPATGGISVPATGGTVPLNALTPLTAYEVYVIRDCGTVGTSASAGPVSFFTPCAAPTVTVLPYTENFDTTPAGRLPCGWTTENVNGDTIEWRNRRANASSQSTPNALVIRWNPTEKMNDWAFSPGIRLTAGQNYAFTFSYRVGAATSAEALEVSAGTGPSSAQMTIPLFSDGRLINATYRTTTITFAVSTSGVYHFGFHGLSEANRLRIFIDDIRVEQGAACPAPTNLLAQNVTATTATLGFTPAPGGLSYTFIYGPSGFNPATSGTQVPGTGPTGISGLNPLTPYEFYVRTSCGATGQSALVGPQTFTTLCPPPTLSAPLTENFDAVAINTLPCGWTTINANADTAQWRILNLANLTQSPPNGFRIESPTPKDDWFVTPAVQLFAGVTYDLSFETRSGGAPEALEVRVGTAATAAGLLAGEQIFNDTALVVNTFPNPVAAQFTPTVSGTYYLGWHAYTGRDADRLYVDNIALTPSAICEPATALSASLVTGTSATISFSPGLSATYTVVYGSFGFNPITGGTTVAATDSSAILTGLIAGSTYQVYVVSTCAGGAPALAGPISFSTVVGLQSEALAQAVQVYPNPATDEARIVLRRTGAARAHLTVYDALGRVVHTAALADNATYRLPVGHLAPGLYSVRIALSGGADAVVTRPLSIQR